MRTSTRDALQAINHRFYTHNADSFARTRQSPWPGWDLALEEVQSARNERPGTVLDAAAGNGRFGDYLVAQQIPLKWFGTDLSLPLLGRARLQHPGTALCADLDVLHGLPIKSASFDVVVAFGLFHHIPSSEARDTLLGHLASLLKPGGRLVLTHWQFAEVATIAKRFLPWQNAQQRHPSIDLQDLEDGDHLVGWGIALASIAAAIAIM